MEKAATLEILYEIVQDRKKNGSKHSYSTKLFRKGRKKIAQKLGEEAVEVVIDAIAGDEKNVVYESADLLYHLTVLWADMDIAPQQIWEELERRMHKGK